MRIGQRDHVQDSARVVDLVRDRVGPGPWFVKPACGGSSLGIGRADTPAGLHAALAESFRWGDAAMVEEAVPHRELVLGLIGRDEVVVSPPGECIAVGSLYTYEEKYLLGNPRFTCPAQVDGPLTGQAQKDTIPGMAATSVFPKVMRAAGYTYPELLAELCRLAAQG